MLTSEPFSCLRVTTMGIGSLRSDSWAYESSALVVEAFVLSVQ